MSLACHRPRRAAAALIAALGAVVSLAACGDAPVVPEGAQVITVQLTSQDRVLHTVGRDDSKIYGSNHLTGDGAVDGGDAVQVEMLATVNYTDGSGDFGGVITFTYADGSTLGVVMEGGAAEAATDTTEATFHSALRVIGGTGALLDASGTGTFVGTRKEALGGAVEATFTLSISS